MRGDSSPPDDVRDIFHETSDRWRARWHAWMSVPPAEWPRAVRWGLAGAAWAIGLALAWSVWWLVGLPARATLQKDLAVAQQTLDRANEAARRLPILMQTLRDAQAQAAAWRRLLPAAGAETLKRLSPTSAPRCAARACASPASAARICPARAACTIRRICSVGNTAVFGTRNVPDFGLRSVTSTDLALRSAVPETVSTVRSFIRFSELNRNTRASPSSHVVVRRSVSAFLPSPESSSDTWRNCSA